MHPEESLYPEDWIAIAEKDLRRVEDLLGLQDPEAAGFFLQQAIEKFLKAFLLSKGWKLERIHDLEALLNRALRLEPALEPYRQACQKIAAYYLIERYPFITETGLSEDDVRDSLEQVRGLVEIVRRGVRR